MTTIPEEKMGQIDRMTGESYNLDVIFKNQNIWCR